jgi:hypothetical protein
MRNKIMNRRLLMTILRIAIIKTTGSGRKM